MFQGHRFGALIVSLILLAVAVAPATAASEPSTATFSASGPPELSGRVQIESALGAFRIQNHSEGLRLSVSNASLDVVTVRVRVVETPRGDVGFDPESSTRRYEDVDGVVSVLGSDGFVLVSTLASSGAANRLVLNGTVEKAAFEPRALRFDYSFRMNASLEYFYQSAVDGPGFAMGEPGWTPDVRMEGAGEIFVAGARLTAKGRDGVVDVTLDSHEEPLAAPLGQTGGRVDVYSFGVLRPKHFVLESALRGTENEKAFLATDTLHLTGVLECDDCAGNLVTPRTTYVAAGEDSVIRGDFDVTYAQDASGGFAVRGEVTSARLGDQVAYETPALAKAGIVAAILAFLLSLSSVVRAMGGRLAGIFYTRLRPRDVLKSAERAAMLRAVVQEPGVHLRELQRTLGYGWGKLHYHLGVLERSRLVSLAREGKHVHVFCMGEVPAARLHTLKLRGAAQKIFEAVRDGGPLSQAAIAASLRLSTQLVGHHLRALERDGLVSCEPSHPMRYSALVGRDKSK